MPVIKRGPYKKASVEERLRRRTRIDGECWLWTGVGTSTMNRVARGAEAVRL